MVDRFLESVRADGSSTGVELDLVVRAASSAPGEPSTLVLEVVVDGRAAAPWICGVALRGDDLFHGIADRVRAEVVARHAQPWPRCRRHPDSEVIVGSSPDSSGWPSWSCRLGEHGVSVGRLDELGVVRDRATVAAELSRLWWEKPSRPLLNPSPDLVVSEGADVVVAVVDRRGPLAGRVTYRYRWRWELDSAEGWFAVFLDDLMERIESASGVDRTLRHLRQYGGREVLVESPGGPVDPAG